MGSAPDIIPTTELRRDAAGVIARAGVLGVPAFVTQHGRATADLIPRAEYERLFGGLERAPALVRTRFGLADSGTAEFLAADGLPTERTGAGRGAQPVDVDVGQLRGG